MSVVYIIIGIFRYRLHRNQHNAFLLNNQEVSIYSYEHLSDM